MAYLRGANGAEAHRVLGSWNTDIAGMIGACLGGLHALGNVAAAEPLRRHLPARLPWALAPPDPALSGRRAIVLSVFNGDREVASVPASLRREYRFSTLIHGDATRPASDRMGSPRAGSSSSQCRQHSLLDLRMVGRRKRLSPQQLFAVDVEDEAHQISSRP